jgi:hypothetical protein
MSLFSDTSGVAKIGTRNWISRVLVAYAGYTGSSLSAVALFYALSKGKHELILISFTALLFICFLFWIRNFYGILWSVSILCMTGYMIWKGYSVLIVHISILLTAIILAQSISSAFTILKMSFSHSNHAGDAASLASATRIPAPFWGLLFFIQALYAAYFISIHYLNLW